MCVCAQSCPTLCDPIYCSHQAPLSMEFSREEYWSGLPFPILEDLLDPRIKPVSLGPPTLAGGFFTTMSPVQVSSVAQSCLTLDAMDCIMSNFPVLHQLPELTQTHVHQVGDAIQPSHPLLSASPPAFNLSQHQGLF